MNETLLHPVINHFTIALITISVLLDIIGLISKKESFHKAAWYNFIVGAIAGLFTVITGLIAEVSVAHGEAAHEIMETHETLGFIILGLVLILLIWRIITRGNFPVKGSAIYIVIAILTVGTIFVNGFYGGEMVFKHGVAVQTQQVSTEETQQHEESKTTFQPDTAKTENTNEIHKHNHEH